MARPISSIDASERVSIPHNQNTWLQGDYTIKWGYFEMKNRLFFANRF